MPLRESTYRAPFPLRNPHAHTAWAGLVRSAPDPGFVRERLELPDGDFLDLDWMRRGRSRLAILCHGLEGNTRRPYMVGMARALDDAGWDVLAWNYRGCSGVPNRLLRSYHSGATDDLEAVIGHAGGSGQEIGLVGFSLGGNLVLKYLGETGASARGRIRAAATFSVPADLRASSLRLEDRENRPYMRRFMRTLRRKARMKHALFPDRIDLSGIDGMTTFREFDDRFTAPVHGFRDAEDYWARCSSRSFIGGIRVPALIVNALDDPFLAGDCYPVEACRSSAHVTLEQPLTGGHVGFASWRGPYGSETRAVRFLESADPA